MAGDRAFLGMGWSFPPVFSRAGATVETVGGEELIREGIWILLSTSPGERVMLPTYGSGLQEYVFRALTTTLLTEIEDTVSQAIVLWEPRVDLTAVRATANPTIAGRVDVEIDYVIRQTNARSNMVYPFYLHEGSIPSAQT